MSEDAEPHAGPLQLERELCNVINRYTDESDLRIYELIGILEKVKADYLHRFHQYHDERDKE